MPSHFRPGDTVILKSGSPVMKIEHVAYLDSGKEIVLCRWLVSDEPRSVSFPVESLVPTGV
jgi:uncharacterized protein YodC (DUF2158 family)